MTRGAGRSAPISTLVFAVSLSWGAVSHAQSPAPTTLPGSGSSTTLTATVRFVDTHARRLEVNNPPPAAGVSHAPPGFIPGRAQLKDDRPRGRSMSV